MINEEEIVMLSPDFGPSDPDYMRKLGNWARQRTVRLIEEKKPKDVTFRLSEDARLALQGALHDAKEHTGTNRNSKALAHICVEYLQRGPKVRAMESLTEKNRYRGKRLEQIMAEMGPAEVMRVFNRTFPAHLVDYPK
jgi:hypothetical protein